MFDAVVVGGGPAGASCAQWLQALGFAPALVEARPRLGGLENDDPYPNRFIVTSPAAATGIEIAETIDRNVRALGVPVLTGTRATGARLREDNQFEIAVEGERVLRGRCLVVASGVSPASGGLTPGPRVLIGPGRQIEEAELAGAKVAILGGGDNAFENYGLVLRKGAASVRVFARTVQARLGFLEQVPHGDVRVGAYAVDTERLTVAGERFDVILVLYGWTPNLAWAAGLGLALDARGFVAVDPRCRTSVEGVYAVGEATQRSHPCCVTAMADGAVAAKAIEARLEAGRRAVLIKQTRRP